MKEKLLNYFQKRHNLNFLIVILSYIIPISIFGHWNIYNLIYFPISILVLSYLLYYKAIDGVKWPDYLASGLQGFSTSMYGISIIGMTMQGSMIQVSVYSGILVYLLSSVPFVIFSSRYRDDVKREYDSSFYDEKSKERDKKLNKILGF
jgi:hypothetical protein